MLNSELRHLDGIRPSANVSQLHQIIPIYSFLFLFPHFVQTNGFPTSRKSISVLECRYDIYYICLPIWGRDRNSPSRIKWMFSSEKWSINLLVWVHLISFVPQCDLTHSKFIETSQNCHAAMPWQNDCGCRCQILWDGFSGQDSRKDHQVRIPKSWKNCGFYRQTWGFHHGKTKNLWKKINFRTKNRFSHET